MIHPKWFGFRALFDLVWNSRRGPSRTDCGTRAACAPRSGASTEWLRRVLLRKVSTAVRSAREFPPRAMTEREGMVLIAGICPACGHAPLRPGPCGGGSQNMLCPTCLNEFLLCPVAEWCEWMGVASPARLEWPYGIRGGH